MKHRHRHIKNKTRHLGPKKRFYKKTGFWIFVVFVLMSTALYFTLFFDKLQIESIQISGNENVKSADIERIAQSDINKKIFGFIATKSIFVASQQDIAKDILAAFPEIESAEVFKKFPQSIALKISERQPVAVFCGSQTAQSCFFIDKNGVIFQPIHASETTLFIVRQDIGGKQPFVGENVISKNVMDMMLQIQKSLKDNFQIDIKEAFASNPLVVTTSENWQIYFDPSADVTLEVKKMDELLKNEISPDARETLQYIYLQYKDRAYYK